MGPPTRQGATPAPCRPVWPPAPRPGAAGPAPSPAAAPTAAQARPHHQLLGRGSRPVRPPLAASAATGARAVSVAGRCGVASASGGGSRSDTTRPGRLSPRCTAIPCSPATARTAQAEPAAGGRAAASSRTKRRNTFRLGRRDAGAVVGHHGLERPLPPRRPTRTVEPAGVWRIAFSIRLTSSWPRSAASPRIRRSRRHARDQPLLGPPRPRRRPRRVGHELGEVELPEARAARAGLDLGDAQQGAEGIQDRVGLCDGARERRAVLGGGGARAAGLEVVAQAAERRAQVVGDVARHLPQAVHQLS